MNTKRGGEGVEKRGVVCVKLHQVATVWEWRGGGGEWTSVWRKGVKVGRQCSAGGLEVASASSLFHPCYCISIDFPFPAAVTPSPRTRPKRLQSSSHCRQRQVLDREFFPICNFAPSFSPMFARFVPGAGETNFRSPRPPFREDRNGRGAYSL